MNQKEKLLKDAWLLQGKEPLEDVLSRLEEKNKKTFLIFIVLFAIFFVLSFFSSPKQNLEKLLERPGFGEESKSIQLKLSARYQDIEKEETVNIEVKPCNISEEEAEELFKETQNWLSSLIPKELFKDFELPKEDQSKKVQLSWFCENTAFSPQDGKLSLISCKDGEEIELFCQMLIGSFKKEISFKMILMPSLAEKEELLNQAISEEIEKLSKSEEGNTLLLPKDSSGIVFSWQIVKENQSFSLLFMFLLILLLLWFGRFDSLKKDFKNKKAHIPEEISDISSQLILLLDAGLVSSSAFSKLISQNKGEDGTLYKALESIEEQSRNTNSSFTGLFYDYALKSGSRELLRFATLVKESALHGSLLSEKLQQENERMHSVNLNRIKARARENETKLCFPLLLLLISLLLIAAGPVLLEM